jgi:hypothetical protein
MSQREEVAVAIIATLKKRLRINLRAGVLSDIVVHMERAEFTDHSGKARIEDTSVAYIAKQIRAQRWVWSGADSAQVFSIRVPVTEMFSKFQSLESLNEWNARDSSMVMPKKVMPSRERSNA